MPDLQSPIFALDFSTKASDQKGPSMTFGGIDPTKFHGQLASTPIDRSTNRWTAKDITFSIRGEQLDESADMSFGTFSTPIALGPPKIDHHLQTLVAATTSTHPCPSPPPTIAKFPISICGGAATLAVTTAPSSSPAPRSYLTSRCISATAQPGSEANT